MEREQELKKLINVLHRTARAAVRVQWMNAGEGEARFAVSQFNRILARLGELDPNSKTVFEPLAEDSSLTTVAMACRQVVSYYEDEVKVEEEGWGRGFAAGFKVPGRAGTIDFNLEELGNVVRDCINEIWREREKRADRKHCG
ncbi:MAG: hypothetical protein L0226_01215 [Acidobacteria bacterium]|nr:hypothetical protein [Acidobacteriota bacterium]